MSTDASSRPIRTRDGTGTREAILEAGTRLVHVHGYQATSLDDVLRESGIGKGNFYYHFHSKEELGYAILDRLVDAFVAHTLEPCFVESGGPPLDRVAAFLDRVVEAQRRLNCVGGCVFGNLAAELSDVHEGFRERLARIFSAWEFRLAATLAEATRRGELPAGRRPEVMARFLVASLEGAILVAKLRKDIAVLEQCVSEMKRYLLADGARAGR